MEQLPKSLQYLFWDIKLETFNPLEYPEYTINRVLELGDKDAFKWLKEIFPETKIKDVLKSDKKLSPKSANFWGIIFKIPKNEIAAFNIHQKNL